MSTTYHHTTHSSCHLSNSEFVSVYVWLSAKRQAPRQLNVWLSAKRQILKKFSHLMVSGTDLTKSKAPPCRFLLRVVGLRNISTGLKLGNNH